MKFKLEVNMDNAAFEENSKEELTRILKETIKSLEQGFTGLNIRDINGNIVGAFTIVK